MNKKTLRIVLLVALLAVLYLSFGAKGTELLSAIPSAPTEDSLPTAERAEDALTLLPPQEMTAPETERETEDDLPDEDGSYTGKDELALYIHTYGHLPPNFIKKKDAEKAGWSGGSLEKVLPGMCIGGDYFGNYEGQLPTAKGRRWTECDVNTLGARSRGAERIIFSNDGLIYYTDDHYESFERLY